MADGQVAVNTNTTSPGLFLKDSGSGLLKIGPTHIGSTAPNASPAAGGQTGNSVGEQWLDISTTNPVLKVWNGSAWATVAAAVLATARQINGTNFDGSASITTAEWGTGRTVTIGSTARTVNGSQNVGWTLAEIGAQAAGNYVTTDDVNQTIAGTKTFSSLISGSVSGNAGTATTLATARNINGTSFNGSANITTAEWGTSRSLTIGGTARSVNGSTNYSWSLSDIGALPAAGGTATGAISAPSFIPTGNTAPTNGLYLPATNSVGISTNGTGQLFIDSAGNVGIGSASPTARLYISGTNALGGIRVEDLSTSSPAPAIEVIGKRSDANVSTSFAGKLLLSKNRTDAAIQATNNLGALAFGGNHTDGTFANILYSASIAGRADGAFNSSTDMPTALVFLTGSTGRSPDTANVDTGTERMRLDSTGRLGLGTSSPDARLDVNDSAATSMIIRRNGGSDTNTNLRFQMASSYWALGVGSDDSFGIARNSVNTSTGSTFRISSGGNVGIGTSSPSTLLHVSGSSTSALARIASTASGATTFDGSGAGLELTCFGANATSKYTPAIKFGSTDVDFTTTNPKFGAAITAEATSGYTSDTSGGMTLGFWTSPNNPGTGNGLVQRMTVTNAGNVGIGTTSPNEALEVEGNIHVSGADRSIFNRSNNALTFGTNNTERARIDSAGRVLIGTSSTRAFRVGGTSLQPDVLLESDSNAVFAITRFGGTAASRLILQKAAGTQSAPSIIAAGGDNLGEIRFSGYDGSVLANAARIAGDSDGTPGAGDMPGRLTFSTTPVGSVTPTERMRIDSSGNVGIAVTPSSLFHIRGTGDVVRLDTSGGEDQDGVSLRFHQRDTTIVTDQGYGGIEWEGSDSSNAGVRGYIKGFGEGATGQFGLRFATQGSGASNPVEHMRLDSTGHLGLGTISPATLLHVSGSSTTSLVRIASTSVGASSFDGSGSGLELTAGNSNTTSKYTPAIKFGSTDSDFATTNPKFGAAITAEATSNYNTNTSGGMALGFWTSPNTPGTGSGLVQRMTVTEAGNVGIGTTSPNALLTVNGIGAFGAGAVTTPSIAATGDLDTGFWFPAANTIAASTGGSERARIDSAGRLLVGTGSVLTAGGVSAMQQISTDGGTGASIYLSSNRSNNAIFSQLLFAKARGTEASKAVVSNDEFIGQLNWLAFDGTSTIEATRLSAEVDGTPGTGSMPGRLVFSTTPSGSASPTERMRLDSSGRLGLGSSSPAVKFELRGISNGTSADAVFRLYDQYNGGFTAQTDNCAIEFFSLDNNGPGAMVRSKIANTVEDTSGAAQALTFSTTTNTSGQALTERLRISHNGNVGIGTNSPNESLEVAGNIHVSGADRSIFNRSNNALTFGTNNTERMRIRNNGNIGIGGAGGNAVTLYNQAPITGATTAYGNYTQATIESNVTVLAYGYRTSIGTAAETFTLNNLHCYNATQAAFGAGSTVVNQFGFACNSNLTGATNNYGFHSSLSAATGRWNFFADGTAPSYFAGDIRTNATFTSRNTPTNSNNNATATAASLINGLRTGTPGANINLTLPTGANMDAQFQELQDSQAFEWSLINLAAATHVITVVANTTHTVVGNMGVAAASSGRFLTRKTAANTFITYRIA
jgi:hypothetical protein